MLYLGPLETRTRVHVRPQELSMLFVFTIFGRGWGEGSVGVFAGVIFDIWMLYKAL